MRFIPATTVFVIATVIALIGGLWRDGKFALFPIIAGSFVISFGLATIIFHEPKFLMIKDSIYHAALGFLLLVGFMTGTMPLKRLFRSLFSINDKGWHLLSILWMIFFFAVAIVNEIVWRNCRIGVWVDFKIGVTLCTILFGVLQVPIAWKTRLPDANGWGLRIKH